MTANDFEQRWRRRFAQRGTQRDDDAGIAGWTETGLATRVRRFRALWQQAGDHPPGTWLDIGCGAGTYSRLLHEQGHRVIGLDYAVPSLHKAQQRSPGDGLAWLSADIQQLPLRSGEADGILCFGVMQALASPHGALAEMFRVLRPGGQLWVDALNARCLPTRLAEWRRRRAGRDPHLRYDHPAVFQEAVLAAGFVDVRLYWLPIVPGRLRGLQPLFETAVARWTLHSLPRIGAGLSHSLIVRAQRTPETRAN